MVKQAAKIISIVFLATLPFFVFIEMVSISIIGDLLTRKNDVAVFIGITSSCGFILLNIFFFYNVHKLYKSIRKAFKDAQLNEDIKEKEKNK